MDPVRVQGCAGKTAIACGETYDGRRSDEWARFFAAVRLQADRDYQAQPAPSADYNVELRHPGGGTAARGFAVLHLQLRRKGFAVNHDADQLHNFDITNLRLVFDEKGYFGLGQDERQRNKTLPAYLKRVGTLRLPAGPSFRSCSRICRTADNSSSYHFHAS